MGLNGSIEGSNPSFSAGAAPAAVLRPPAEGWQSDRMRRSRKPLSVVRRIEGSNPSPSAWLLGSPAPGTGLPNSRELSGDLVGAPAASATRARPGSRHPRRPMQDALVLGADGESSELDLLAAHAAVDGVLAAGSRELDRPVQQSARLCPVNGEVTRNGAAVLPLPFAAELRLSCSVRRRRSLRSQRRTATGESEQSRDAHGGKPPRDPPP